ncbi:25499_t:CDS:2 [Gigaspora margarita]|uniref:25499_t:CDS:1 n=1 Tax=Gigaspora margarita TaxID=4874 RepID=A0ABM8VZZ2_GIGMA|nr:25499_t:CDS:2 [Gigaspora margarita]
MAADRSRLRADSSSNGKLSTVNAERSGKNNPVSRLSNCFFQFKRIVSQYATQRYIPGYNDQNIPIKTLEYDLKRTKKLLLKN